MAAASRAASTSTTSSAAALHHQQQKRTKTRRREKNIMTKKKISEKPKTQLASSSWSKYLLEPITYSTTSSSFFKSDSDSDSDARATNGNGADSARCVSSLLTPNWRSMLFGDASVTKTLQLLTLETTKIKLIAPHQEQLALTELPIEAQSVFNGEEHFLLSLSLTHTHTLTHSLTLTHIHIHIHIHIHTLLRPDCVNVIQSHEREARTDTCGHVHGNCIDDVCV